MTFIAAAVAVIAIVGIIFFGILPRMKQNHALAEESTKQKNAVPQVVVVSPTPSPDADLTLPGTMQAIADATIGARSTGYVTQRLVDIGTRVTAGQLLAVIQSPDVEAQEQQARQQTVQVQATVHQAESDVSSRRASVAQQQSAVQQAAANVETARAQLADAEAKLAQAQAQVGTAQSQLAQTQQTVDIKRAALKQAQTQFDLADVTLRRYQTLLKAGYVALQDVDQSQANYDTTKAAVNSASADVRGAEANVQAAQSQVESARSNVTAFRAQVTAAQKNVKAVQSTVGSAQAAVQAAKSNVTSAQAVVQSDQAAVQAARANEQRAGVISGFSRITAPFAGVITARNIDVGSLVNAGGGSAGASSATSTSTSGSAAVQGSAASGTSTPSTTPGAGLFGLARTDTLRVLVSVPQTYAPLMHPNETADLFVREFPGRPFVGTIHHVAGAIDAVSRTLLTEIHIPNPTGTLLPGMYVQVHFNLPKTRGSLRIPSNTLMFDAQGTRVAIVTPENKLHFVPVHVGRDFGTDVEVTEGLTGKEALVSNPTDDLVENEKVTPKQAPPPPPGPGGATGGPAGGSGGGQQGGGPKAEPGKPPTGQMGTPPTSAAK